MNTLSRNLKIYMLLLLLCGLLLPQLALSETTARAHYFDGKFLTASDLQSIQIRIPGLYNPATGERSTREDFEKPIVITKYYDENSASLADAYYNKLPIAKMQVEVEVPSKDKNRRSSYLRYELTNVIISSYSVSTGDNDQEPLENITLSFAKCEIAYFD